MSLPEIIGGKYRPRRIVGAGSTGTVYSVEHTSTGEQLALKVMTSHLGGSPEAVARFKREALVVSKIRSQHVVRIFDADVAPELDGAPFLVMDLLEGLDLDRLSEGKPIEAKTVVHWLRQVADPLDKAHRLGIVHRDLKPENLFLTQTESGSDIIKILDFGIARIATESMATEKTQWGQLLGTPLYMAPEQARGDPTQVSAATDLYALGLIAYKLLTGTSYRTGTSVTVMLEEIVRGPVQAPSELGTDFGPEFDCWFLRACHPEPQRRFVSAEAQVIALGAALGIPIEAEGTPSPSSGPRQSLKRNVRNSLIGDQAAQATFDATTMAQALAASAAERAAMTPPSPLGATYEAVPPKQIGWRFAFFGAAAVVILLLLTLTLSHSTTPPSIPQGMALHEIAPIRPTEPPAPPAPAPERSSPPAPAFIANATITATASAAAPATEKEPARAAAPRVYPTRVWVAPRPRAVANDDPLSDQQ